MASIARKRSGDRPMGNGSRWCRRRDSNPHALRLPGLSRLRLPFRHSGAQRSVAHGGELADQARIRSARTFVKAPKAPTVVPVAPPM